LARSVTAIFILQGVIIGLVGTSAGALIGVTVSRVLDRYQLIRVPVDVYQVSYLPFTILPIYSVMRGIDPEMPYVGPLLMTDLVSLSCHRRRFRPRSARRVATEVSKNVRTRRTGQR